MSRSRRLCIALVGSVCLNPLLIQVAFGQDAFDVLQVPPSADVQGMGSASVFTDAGIAATWGNVGALGCFVGIQGVFSHHSLVGSALDWHHTYASIAKGFHVGNSPIGIAASYARRDYGEVESDPLDPPNSVSYPSFEEVFGLAGGLGVSERVSLGVGVKLVAVELPTVSVFGVDKNDGTALAFDLGALWVPISTRNGLGKRRTDLRLALAIRNLGADFKPDLDEGSIPLPTTIGIGVEPGWEFGSAVDFYGLGGSLKKWAETKSLFGFRLGAAFERGINAGDGGARFFEYLYTSKSFSETNKTVWRLGAEVSVLALVSGRIGYVHDEASGIKELTWGIGLSAFGIVGLDYAQVPKSLDSYLSQLENDDRISVWVRIPPPVLGS